MISCKPARLLKKLIYHLTLPRASLESSEVKVSSRKISKLLVLVAIYSARKGAELRIRRRFFTRPGRGPSWGFDTVFLFLVAMCYTYGYFLLNENIHSCIQQSRVFIIIRGIRHVISDEMPVNITSSMTNKICLSDKLYQLVTSQKSRSRRMNWLEFGTSNLDTDLA